MTNAEHLIENAIYALKDGYDYSCDINAEDTNCTLEEAKMMATHIVYSLYDGKFPEDVQNSILSSSKDFHFGDKLVYTSRLHSTMTTPCVFIRKEGKTKAVVMFKNAEFAARVYLSDIRKIDKE